MLTPERDLAPFWPRPAVLPSPEPIPRPTRTRLCRAPLLSLSWLSFMSLHSLSLLSRFASPVEGEDGAPEGSGRVRTCCASHAPSPQPSPSKGEGEMLCRVFDLHQMLHLLDLAANLGRVLDLDALAHLVEA